MNSNARIVIYRLAREVAKALGIRNDFRREYEIEKAIEKEVVIFTYSHVVSYKYSNNANAIAHSRYDAARNLAEAILAKEEYFDCEVSYAEDNNFPRISPRDEKFTYTVMILRSK